MAPETKEEITKRVALQLQIALTAWSELYPEDTDEDACRKSFEIVEYEVEDLMTRPEPPSAPPEQTLPPYLAEYDEDVTIEAVPPRVRRGGTHPRSRDPQGTPSFRQMLLEIGREHPRGLSITAIVDKAQARGWSHPNARNYVSITASQLVRAGLLVRPERGIYALSPALLGGDETPKG